MKTKQKRSKTTNPRKPVRCQYCGAVAVLRPASEIYGDEKRTDMLYVCGHYLDITDLNKLPITLTNLIARNLPI